MFKKISKKYFISLITIMFCFLLTSTSYAEVFSWPFASFTVASKMKWRNLEISTGMHDGWDIWDHGNLEIHSVGSGTIVGKGYQATGGGNYITMKYNLSSDLKAQDMSGNTVSYGNTLYCVYMHMAHPSPYNQGEQVAMGTVIGIEGTTGASTGNHLHLEFRSQATGGGSIGKSGVTGLGDRSGNNTDFAIVVLNSNPQKATFAPDVIIGQDLSCPVDAPVNHDDLLNGGETEDTGDGGNQTTDGLTTGRIIDREDVLNPLAISTDLITYGELQGLEETTLKLKDVIDIYCKLIGAILIFLGVTLCGFEIVLNRNNAEKRLSLLTGGVGGIGVGALIIGSAAILVDFIAKFM